MNHRDTEKNREQYQRYLRGETDDFPYLDDEEKELIESIENGDDYVPMPKDEEDKLIGLMKQAIENRERTAYSFRHADFQVLKQTLQGQGANEDIIKTLEDFMSDKMVVPA